MHDMLGLTFAFANLLIAFIGNVFVVMGIIRFKTGLLAVTLKRAFLTGVFLFLFFLVEALMATDILPSNTSIGYVLGTLFMLSLLYVTYSFVNDWTHLESALDKKQQG